MINTLVTEAFARIGHTWKIGGKDVAPDETDVEQVLDKAAAALYDSPVGTQFETGGLVIQKATSGFDVFVYVGNYN